MSRTRPSLRICLLVGLGAAVLAAPAAAAPITYSVETGLGFSRVDAKDKTVYLGNIYGDITLDYDMASDTFAFLSSTVWLDSSVYVFDLTGGVLQGDGEGHLDFDLVGTGAYAQSATFFFQGGDPVCCGPDGPNYATVSEIKLYGSSLSLPGGAPAVTLNVTAGSPMPEPSATLVFAAGALLVYTGIRQRSRRTDPPRADASFEPLAKRRTLL